MVFLSTSIILFTIVSIVHGEFLQMSPTEIDLSRIIKNTTSVTIAACYMQCDNLEKCDSFGITERHDGQLYFCHLMQKSNNLTERERKKTIIEGSRLIRKPSPVQHGEDDCCGEKIKTGSCLCQVCYGAKNNDFAEFTVRKTGQIKAIRLTHISGSLSCMLGKFAKWGCPWFGSDAFTVVVTNEQNQVLFPESIGSDMHYKIEGATIDENEVTLSRTHSIHLQNGQKLRIWDIEDLRDHLESENKGKHCVSIQLIYDE